MVRCQQEIGGYGRFDLCFGVGVFGCIVGVDFVVVMVVEGVVMGDRDGLLSELYSDFL